MIFGGRQNKRAAGDMNDLWEFNIDQQLWLQIEGCERIEDPKMITGIKDVVAMNSIITTL